MLINGIFFILRYIPLPFFMYFYSGQPLISYPVNWLIGSSKLICTPGCKTGDIGISGWFMSCKYSLGLFS